VTQPSASLADIVPRNLLHHRTTAILRYVFSAFFILAGLNHFRIPDFYVRMMPPYLPWPLLLVSMSGLFEIVLGAALAVPRLQRLAAWGLIALLIAVFPANIHMAIHPEWFPEFSTALLWARLPVQALLLAWAYWYTKPDPSL
jgi:uncharacterized membrane protein